MTTRVLHRGPTSIGVVGLWHKTLETQTWEGDLVVTPGERWLLAGDVSVEGNTLVQGMGTQLAMRPGGAHRTVGADPDLYVGGGMHYGSKDNSNDLGIWVWNGGKLDFAGTPKVGWTYDPYSEPTWDLDNDEMWIAPTDEGDVTPRRWYNGDPIPTVPLPPGEVVPPGFPVAWNTTGIPAEVVNVTRDCKCYGPGHIHIHSMFPQIFEYVELRDLGVILPSAGDLSGRYALHFHHMGAGAAGTVVQGVSAVGSRGHVFVTHESDGITLLDDVAVESWAEPMWWDVGDDADDILVDRMCILGIDYVNAQAAIGGTSRFDGMTLGSGLNIEVRNSVVAGIRNNKLSTGYDWVSGGQAPNPVWIFETANIAHNCSGPGIRFWTNLDHEHVVSDFICYRNDEGGVENGAYQNRVSYADGLLIDDHFHQQANSDSAPVQTHDNLVIYSPREVIRVGHRKLPPDGYSTWTNCVLNAAPGFPVVFVTDAVQPWFADFHDCGVVPDDFEFESYGPVNRDPDIKGTDGSHVRIYEASHDGGATPLYEILITGGAKVVTDNS